MRHGCQHSANDDQVEGFIHTSDAHLKMMDLLHLDSVLERGLSYGSD